MRAWFTALCLAALSFSCDKLPNPPPAPSRPGAAEAALAAKPSDACDVHPGTETARVFKVGVEGSPALGDASAPVTLVEFSDYQCPFCGRAHQTVEALLATYGDKVRLVMKQAPLPFHANAKPAALAALAAQGQGRFWQMHRALFAHQDALDEAGLAERAAEAGLDVGRWRADLQSPAVSAELEKELALGKEVGVSGTPTFFINGRKLVGAQPAAAFRAVIDEELEKAGSMVRAGVRPDEVYAHVQEHACDRAADVYPAAPVKVEIDVGRAPVKGSASAPVTLVVYSDFQCPFCGRAVQTLKALEARYGDRLRIAFKQHPLPFHDKARLAAQAALAANEQGRFWEYHDLLFANQNALDRASLESYAEQLHLDLGRFRSALDTGRFDADIAAESAEAARVGANGTPTFYVNGRQIMGAQPVAVFESAIDAELEKPR